MKFRSIVIGEGALVIPCAEILLRHGHTIVSVVSANPAIAVWAREQSIAVIAPGELVELSRETFDYLFSVANLRLVPPRVLALARRGAINFHDGPLPRYAGLHATTWAILNQESSHGVTWHEMVHRVDAGPILRQRVIALAQEETAHSLNRKCFAAGIESFAELAIEIEAGTVSPREQDAGGRTYFSRYARPEALSLIEWDQPADRIAALVRALDFGTTANPLEIAKVLVNGRVLLVRSVEVLADDSPLPAGTIAGVDRGGVLVCSATKQIRIPRLMDLSGQPADIGDIATGLRLESTGVEERARLTELSGRMVPHEEYWNSRLRDCSPLKLASPPETCPLACGAPLLMTLPAAVEMARDSVVAALALFLGRYAGESVFDIGYQSEALRGEIAEFEGFYRSQVPIRIDIDGAVVAGDAIRLVKDEIARVRARGSYSRTLVARNPELREDRMHVAIFERDDPPECVDNDLAIAVSGNRRTLHWSFRAGEFDERRIGEMQRRFAVFAENLAAQAERPLAEVPLLTEAERRQILVEWNETAKPYPRTACVHHLFEEQVERTPRATAVLFEETSRSYDQLNRDANRMGHYLRELGAGPDGLVAICLERSQDLMTAIMGTLKSGAAYVPLDPAYPAERIALMLEDSQAALLVTQSHLVGRLPARLLNGRRVVLIDTEWPQIERSPQDNVVSDAAPHNLCYVIYTSGSTGKPKGVMVEHGNVVNFFAGMDDRIPHSPPGTWLAVTSLSFDISVLELFWTLARGFKVVLYGGSDRGLASSRAQSMDFSLFYFASDAGENTSDKYQLLLEGAKFGDRHGFKAVWTPERHFEAFGGLYPNPAVTGAAIAAVTSTIHVRAGSVVAPLHNPIRIAEDWAVVDNLSGGRAGIAFAAGWQPNDFALRPENYADRKAVLFRDIETVRRLWRGETVRFPGGDGDVEVRTLPRPVQKELPVWVTIAGNPETFEMAGRGGYHVLTHLLGQTTEQLAEKLRAYRKAWRLAGHPGKGHVVLMLHAFVGSDGEVVREIVRGPMTRYLESALDLTEKAAWSFPTFQQRATATGESLREMFTSQTLSQQDKDAILAHAFERYFETSGLFGPVETCMKMVERLRSEGVDEIACLIDFGVPSATVLRQLEQLNLLKEAANPAAGQSEYTIPALIRRHHVTHLQCTPSLAGLLHADGDSRGALRGLRAMMVGGEAFPAGLAQQLRELVLGELINMYGPTETTIWSSTYAVEGGERQVPIGRPIANTSLYVLDEALRPVPVGTIGELFIGGDGVVRGYWQQDDLTADRFLPDPFRDGAQARMYRTGDQARFRANGEVEFLGRNDGQVKLRGYRIELGEIEKLMDQQASVARSVVVVREDTPGDKRLVAYLVPVPGGTVSDRDLRAALRQSLPEFMVPSQFVTLSKFPMTPNLKIDRKALPAPGHAVLEKRPAEASEQAGELEQKLCRVWQELLGVGTVGLDDDFFDAGGHSLLVIQLHRRVTALAARPVAVADMFQNRTVRKMAALLRRAS
ncbi:MAG: LLM class flavin-dependent oxidoreductase [Acidobacteria bacterium]|nr:LLM class flavin-dependent oxidoreductase [Acidobacteriota bacterium]